jgi:hypothetical protein
MFAVINFRRIYSIQSAIFCLHVSYKKTKTKICKKETVILLVALDECKTWSLTLREEHRLRVFEKRVLRIFGRKRKMGHGENCIMMNFTACILHRILLG